MEVRSPLSAPDAQNCCNSCGVSLQSGCSCLLPWSGQRAAAERSGSLIPNPSSAGRAAKLPAAISQSPLLHHLRCSLLGWLVLWVCLQGLEWKSLVFVWGGGGTGIKTSCELKCQKVRDMQAFPAKGRGCIVTDDCWFHHPSWSGLG